MNEELKEAREWIRKNGMGVTYRFDTYEDMLVAYHRHREEKKWVSVKERLPEDTGTVLAAVHFGDTNTTHVDMVYYWHEEKVWKRINDFETVTRWQPLPQPPKE